MVRAKGLIPSPVDPSDLSAHLLLGAAAPPPPENKKLLQLVRIHDQQRTNSCVWFAVAQALRTFLKSRGLDTDFWISVLFGYFNTRRLAVQNAKLITDTGCVPRLAMEVLAQAGFCLEEDWPFDEERVNVQPTFDMYRRAFDRRIITQFYKIDSAGDQRVNDVKTAINSGHPVIYGSPVDAMYESFLGGKVMGVPNGPSQGSHMRCLVAYDREALIEVNSWGESWGDRGTARLAPEVIKWELAHDFWVFTAVPQLA